MRIMGEQTVCAQYHGSIENFESFEHSKLRSLGFHFGDIQQAKHFSGDNGYIYMGRGKEYNNGKGQCGMLMQASYPEL